MSAADWGIPTPSQGMPITPYATPFEMQGDALADALDLLRSMNVPAVANDTERDTIFSVPAQGNRCFRVDKGWEEVYLAAQSGSNPGGSILGAGWYPYSGKLPSFEASSYYNNPISSQAISAGGWARMIFTGVNRIYGITYSTSTGVFTATQPGLYDISAACRLTAGSDQSIAILMDNGIANQVGLQRTQTILPSTSVQGIALKKNQNFSVGVYSGTATTINGGAGPNSLSARYVGPA